MAHSLMVITILILSNLKKENASAGTGKIRFS